MDVAHAPPKAPATAARARARHIHRIPSLRIHTYRAKQSRAASLGVQSVPPPRPPAMRGARLSVRARSSSPSFLRSHSLSLQVAMRQSALELESLSSRVPPPLEHGVAPELPVSLAVAYWEIPAHPPL